MAEAGPANASDAANAPVSASASEVSIPIVMVGGASSVPGQTKEEGCAIIMAALQRAADGYPVLHSCGQRNEWLHRCFIAAELNIGVGTWKFFKKKYEGEIETDEQQQWVRLKPLAVKVPADDTDDDEAWSL